MCQKEEVRLGEISYANEARVVDMMCAKMATVRLPSGKC